jgi:alanine dehydrogenase
LAEILVLSQRDVEELLTMEDAIKAMEEVFTASSKGQAESVGVIQIDASKYGGGWAAKPGYLLDKGYVGVKLGCYYPGNTKSHLPTHLASILLSDAHNGMPLAVLDGLYITTMRTGATGGAAAKHLARRDSKVVGVLGTGTQGRIQLMALKNLFDLKEARAYSPDKGRRTAYARDMTKEMGIPVKAVDSAEAAVRGADIIIAATPSKAPVVKDPWIGEGVHINGIGADGLGKKELESRTYKRSKLVTDKVSVALSKDLFERSDIYAELGEVISGKKKGRESADELTVFDSTGIGIQDVATAAIVYQRANKAGKGKRVRFL